MLIVYYNENWADDFKRLQKVFSDAMVDLSITTEHIGSTSIFGMAAKPIIDIDIVYHKNEFEDIKKRLERIGYYHNGNQGIIDREVFKRNKASVLNNVLDSIAHHLYVCPHNSQELQKHILFRDYLIANEEARGEYQKLKFELAEEANNDRKRYAALKELKAKDFIDSIIEKAKTEVS